MADAVTFADVQGTIISYTIIYIATPEFAGEAPYGLAVIETADGERTLARIPGTGLDGLAIGASVVYDHADDYGPVYKLVS